MAAGGRRRCRIRTGIKASLPARLHPPLVIIIPAIVLPPPAPPGKQTDFWARRLAPCESPPQLDTITSSVWAQLSGPRCAVEIALGRLGDWREDKGGGCGGDCLHRTGSSPAASPCQKQRAPRQGHAQHRRGSAEPVMPDAITRVDRRWKPPQRHMLTPCQHSRTGTFDTGKSSSHCQRQSTSSAVL